MSDTAPDSRTSTLIRGAMLIDGTGAPRRPADVMIANGTIVAISEPGTLSADETIAATGLILAPGFIDVHTHDDYVLIEKPEMTPKISQGITTVIAGNCGISLAPLTASEVPAPLNLLGPGTAFTFPTVAAYAAAVNAAQPATNVCLLVGHGSLRFAVMDDLTRKASPAELDAMRTLLAAAMDEGAIGLSTGLYYKIAEAADIDEVVALAEVIAPHGGIYATHMRNEHEAILDSLEETFQTAGRAGVKVIVSHHKCAGPDNWGRSSETLAVIDSARAHQDLGLDAYPYIAGSTVLEPFLVDERIRITVSWSTPHPELAGRDLADIAADWGVTQPEAAERLKPAGGIYYNMSEDDVRRILAYPHTMIGSDGLPQDTHPHPRLWGTFPRVLGHYARDEGLFSLETAIHKMTGIPAANFGLSNRGIVRPGAAADLVLFDPDVVIDTATFDTPKQPAAGIEMVMVNGVESWRGGAHTGVRGGIFLDKSERARV